MKNIELRKLIRKHLKESYQQETLDLILDKISKYGIESLNPHEKKILDDISDNTKGEKFKSDNDLIFHFLDFNIGKLQGESYLSEKIGKRVSGIKYFNKQKELLFDLEIKSEVLGVLKSPNFLYINNSNLILLSQNFTIDKADAVGIIKLWFEKQTNIKTSKVSIFF